MSILAHKRAHRAPRAAEPPPAPPGDRRNGRLELLGYAAVAVGLFCLLAYRVREVDAFFLDDWLYTHAAEYMGQHLPGAIYGDIPGWTRGAQRLYPAMLAPAWAWLDASTAYSATHLLNAVLLSSAVVPAALLARQLTATPVLRVLAVALAVVMPFLTVSATLLTENLALPLLLWTVYLTARTAAAPTLPNQVGVLAMIAALTLTRLNLAVVIGALFLTVAVAEAASALNARGSVPPRRWLAAFARRRAPLLLAFAATIVAAVWLMRSDGAVFGAYSNSADVSQLKEIWTQWDLVEAAIATYTRSLVTGTFVFPFVLGLAGALAAARGVLGRAAVLPAIATLSTFLLLLVAVSAITKYQNLEERYAFYFYVPVALFAVAGVERLRRMPVELAIASAVAIWALKEGVARAASTSFHFFDAPGGAFWTRVVEHRLRRLEGSLPGWLPGEPSGWLLIAVALGLLVALAVAARFLRLPRLLPGAVVGGGLALCLIAQALALDYGFRALLHGVKETPGGMAGAPGHELDRNDWIDDALPDGAHAVLLPPMPAPGAPYGGAETTQYWNRSLDATLALRFTGAPVVAAAGHSVVESELADGLAGWQGTGLGWLATSANDPRAQFAGRVSKPEASGAMVLNRLEQPVRSVWTTSGLEPDGYVPDGGSAIMTLARSRGDDDVRQVRLLLRGADALPRAAAWRVAGAAGGPLRGRIRAARSQVVRLAVPPCPRSGACGPVSWQLTSSGRPAGVLLPVFGPAPAPRPLRVQLLAARLVRG